MLHPIPSGLLLIGLSLSSIHGRLSAQTSPIERDTLHVYFETASSEIKEGDREFVRAWMQKHSADSISMKAYCDSRGSTRYNDALALKRLNAVRGLLNVPPQWGEALGEREQLAAGTDAVALQQNRVVRLLAFPKTKSSTMIVEEVLHTTSDFNSDFANRLLHPSTSKGDTARPVVLDGLQFQGGTDRFLPEGAEVLAQLLETMQLHAQLRIRITGHVCCVPVRSADGENILTGTKTLSVDRAMAVRSYLMEHGIEAQRIEVRGVGGSKPMYWPEYTERERQGNRRVEVEAIP